MAVSRIIKSTFAVSILAVVLFSCGREEQVTDSLNEKLEDRLAEINPLGNRAFILPGRNNLAAIPQDPRNPLTEAKVALGKMLFHETALGIKPVNTLSMRTYSCASCHSAEAGFQSGLRQGIGEGGEGYGAHGELRHQNSFCTIGELDVQPIRSPSVMNTAYQEVMLWNGQFGATGVNEGTEAKWENGNPISNNFLGYEGVETQAIAGLSVHRMGVDKALLSSEPYRTMFEDAFPDIAEGDRYSLQFIGLAIAAFERSVLSNEAPFQRWLRGEYTALTDAQKRGALIFFDKGGCVSCHNGPALSSMNFYALGLNDLVGTDIVRSDPADNAHKGRGGFTGKAEDDYKFKVPQLYNLRDVEFFGHGGTLRSVEAVVRYKNAGLPENSNVPVAQLSDQFKPLGLSEQEIKDLTNFIENGLHDASLNRYEPSSLPSGMCFPNNDSLSRSHRGCN